MERKAVTIQDILAERILPISRSELYRAVKRGDLRVCRLGRRVLVTTGAIDDFLRKLETPVK